MSEKVLVCIDPGHGGDDPGALGAQSVEADLNLKLAMAARKSLRPDFAVVLTRRDGRDPSESRSRTLAARCEICNDSAADVFLSLHHNSFTSPEPSGFEVLFWHTSTGGKKLAELLVKYYQALSGKYGIRIRGAKARSNLVVLRDTRPPAVLVEAGFISNPAEEEKLIKPGYREDLAGAIAAALKEFFLF